MQEQVTNSAPTLVGLGGCFGIAHFWVFDDRPANWTSLLFAITMYHVQVQQSVQMKVVYLLPSVEK